MRPGYPTMMPITPVIKKLIIINTAIWFLTIVLGWFLSDSSVVFEWFGFIPFRVIEFFWVWQPVTYMFLHSPNIFHLVFNMLLLWWLGGELEVYWGRRFFLFYYFACGIGAAFLYAMFVTIYYFLTGNSMVMVTPVVGASGAIFGLILAYGLLFGERIIYFMMLFPMKARYFVLILGGIEVMNLLSDGFKSKEANLAHLGGLVTGFIILKIGPRIRDYMNRRQTKAYGRKLKLVVDNDRPKYWN